MEVAGSGSRKRRDPNDQRLTVFLDDGAVAGRVVEFTDTGLVARLEGEVPRYRRYRFTLHIQGAVISGDITSLGQSERICRLQFSALTDRDRALLEPYLEQEP